MCAVPLGILPLREPQMSLGEGATNKACLLGCSKAAAVALRRHGGTTPSGTASGIVWVTPLCMHP